MTSTPTPNPANATDAVMNPREDVLKFPTSFPVKVMGKAQDGFVNAVTELAKQFDPTYDASTVELRTSEGGNYLGVTVTITATSREQLDNLYRALTSHPMVKVVL